MLPMIDFCDNHGNLYNATMNDKHTLSHTCMEALFSAIRKVFLDRGITRLTYTLNFFLCYPRKNTSTRTTINARIEGSLQVRHDIELKLVQHMLWISDSIVKPTVPHRVARMAGDISQSDTAADVSSAGIDSVQGHKSGSHEPRSETQLKSSTPQRRTSKRLEDRNAGRSLR